MKRINLFWKTWIVTFFSLLLAGFIFVFSYSYFVQMSYEKTQTVKLQEFKQNIKMEIDKNGIQKEQLLKYPLQGCFIQIFENEKLIYPPNGEGFFFKTDVDPSSMNNIINEKDSTEYLLDKFEIHNYTVELMMPKLAYSYDSFKNFIPSFLVIGLVSTGIISFSYSLYFSRRIRSLNQKMQIMSKMEYEVTEEIQVGDELVDLENNLNEMYLRLKKALDDRVFFTRGATHELKTPIMAVSSMLEGMICNVAGFENKEYYLQECYSQMESMSKLVNEILDLSQINQLQVGQTNLYKVMNELIAVYEIIAQDKGCNILFVCDNKQKEIKILENSLYKVLSNLLSNALKYASDNSTINIELKNGRFSISNEYRGEIEGDIEKLSDPFVQGENAKEGHGLGLYIVKTILTSVGMEMQCFLKNQIFVVTFTI
ncbi:MAG: HAMP domain-containing histidine kinase [Clostridioides sp.]|jgi:signal transduction histidine kinase|nr:HAMP domain-containing histidine kinase [Clostridioides sp.]